jgi:hypothetical protein
MPADSAAASALRAGGAVQIPSRTRGSGVTVSVAASAAAAVVVPTETASAAAAFGWAVVSALVAEVLPPRAVGDDAARAVRTAGVVAEATVIPALAAMSPAVSAADPAKSARIPMVHPLRFWNAGRP